MFFLRRCQVAFLMMSVPVVGGVVPCARASDPPTYIFRAQLDLGGDQSSATAINGGIAGNARIPGGESHAFIYQNGRMTDLGTFGGIRSSATIVDNAGDVFGVSQTTQGLSHAFEYQNGTITDLGNYVGAQLYSAPLGIDSAGEILIAKFGLPSTGNSPDRVGLLKNGQFTDIGTLGGSLTRAFGMNANGEVVGYSTTDSTNSVSAAFAYDDGVMTNLAAVPGVLATATYSEADGVSANGLVAGTYSTAGNFFSHAFLYANGKTTDIGTLGGSGIEITNVAADGTIYGNSNTAAGVYHAFKYVNGTMTDLGSLGGTNGGSSVNASNDAGRAVGGSSTAVDGQNHPVIFSSQGLTDLGTLGGKSGYAQAINSFGTVVGSSLLSDNVTSHAFVYQNGAMSDLGTLGGVNSSALSVNDSGEIVGSASTAGGEYRALTYVNGQVTAIPTLGGVVSQSNSANASGAVVGYSQTSSGAQHAFLYQDGAVTDLNPLLGGVSSTATAINAGGEIAGTYQPAGADASHQHAFIYLNGTITDLGTLGQASSSATVINAKGDVAGQITNPNNGGSAFLYANGKMTNIDSFSNANVAAINNNDQVLLNGAGESGVSLYSNGSVLDLLPANAIGGFGTAMNGTGDVVGYYSTTSLFDDGFLYHDGIFTDLNTALGLPGFLRPTDIDDAGDILGGYSPPDGGGYAFLYSGGTFYNLDNFIFGLPQGWTINGARFYPGTPDLLVQAFEGSRSTTFLVAVPEPIAGIIILLGMCGGLFSRRRRPSIRLIAR
jgi:probable HAF family extracellular repeat protein